VGDKWGRIEISMSNRGMNYEQCLKVYAGNIQSKKYYPSMGVQCCAVM
jgi:hypothetical protein